MGVKTTFVTLHVGLGTFRPVKTEKVEEHKMHSEWVEIGAKTAVAINRAKKEGRRVIVVGTTTARTLEGVFGGVGEIKPYSGEINLFITPGFKFKVIDGLITNFHLPKSTLLMLVSAFIGNRKRALQIYNQAVKLKYRFFSFGDAMLICPLFF
jgi:S-adenosylmethionine:tRNA ribosyltransferase-isomerase